MLRALCIPVVHLVVRALSVNACSATTWLNISVLSGEILLKLVTSNQSSRECVPCHCRKGFQRRRSMSYRIRKSKRMSAETAYEYRRMKWFTTVKSVITTSMLHAMEACMFRRWRRGGSVLWISGRTRDVSVSQLVSSFVPVSRRNSCNIIGLFAYASYTCILYM